MRTKRFNPERKATFNRQILTSFIGLIIILMLINPNAFAQVAINTDGSDPSNMAMLDVSATTKGLLIPRMTTFQRNKFEDNLTAAEQGMLVFDTETNCFYFYDGTAFDSISNGVIAILQDADKDTKIQVEKTPDADEIIFTMADTAIFKMLPTRLETPGTNVAIGTNALYSNTDRKYLVAIGDSALYHNGTGAINQTHSQQNTAIGSKSLYANTIGHNNTALGSEALLSNTNGDHNTAVGCQSMYENEGGASNTAVGSNSLLHNTSGDLNTAIGTYSLWSNTTGDNNTAVGNQSLLDNTTGQGNSAFGHRAMYNNTTGYYNTAVGFVSMSENITGNYNTAIGDGSLGGNTSGSSNTCIGRRSLAFNTTGGGNTAMGLNSLYQNTTGSFNTVIGINAMWHNTTGLSNVAIGNSSLYEQESGNFNIAIGAKALYKNDDRSYLIAIGDSALYHNGTGAIYSYHSTDNTAVGTKSLYANTIGSDNTALGARSLHLNTTGDENTAIGSGAMGSNTTGNYNTAIGGRSLLYNTEGHNNVAIGILSLGWNTTGGGNTAVGWCALRDNTIGSSNTAIGMAAMENSTTGEKNVCIGYYAGWNISTGSNNIVIGANANYLSPTDNEKLNIGNLLFGNGLDGIGANMSSGNIGIGNSNPFYKLDISGDDIQLKSSTGGTTVYLDGLSGNSTIKFEESNTFRGSMGYNMDDDYLFLYEGGNVVVKNGNLGVGTTTPGYRLQVGSSGDGSQARANAWNTFSDARLKTNLSVIQDPMNKIQQVSGYYYYWKEGEDAERQVGIIAQEIEEILPEIVSTDAEGIKSVDYSKLTPLLIEAMKAQQEQIEALEARIADMER